MEEKDIKNQFLEFILTILKWKKFLIINVLVILIISTIIAFTLPFIYYSSASVVQPKEESSLLGGSLGGLSSVVKELSPLKGLSGFTSGKGSYNYLVILNSRDVFEKVIQKFNLISVYKVPNNSMEKAIKALSENASFEIREEGNVEIGIYDEDPNRAADMANYFIELLSKKSNEMSVQEVSNNRKFLEGRVKENMDSLTFAENRLKKYQEDYGIYTIPEQAMSIVDATSKLFAEKSLKEIQVNYLESLVTTDNDILQNTKMYLDALNKKINQLPNLGLEYLRLYREVLIRTNILTFLRPMLENSITQEKKNIPVIVVVDYAKPAEYKVKPKRIIIIASATFSALILGILFIFGVEKWRKFKIDSNEDYIKLKNAIRK